MDPRFTEKVIQELRALLFDCEKGMAPSNPQLNAGVNRIIRKQNPDL